jgi:hypothetical protein
MTSYFASCRATCLASISAANEDHSEEVKKKNVIQWERLKGRLKLLSLNMQLKCTNECAICTTLPYCVPQLWSWMVHASLCSEEDCHIHCSPEFRSKTYHMISLKVILPLGLGLKLGVSHSGMNIGWVCSSGVLRKLFWSKRDKVTGQWRRLHNKELHDLYSFLLNNPFYSLSEFFTYGHR